MKKFLLLLLIPLLCGCNIKKEKEVEKKEEVIIETKEIIEDPVNLSLYVDNSFGGLDKVSKMNERWVQKKDIAVFGAIFSDEDTLEPDYFQNTWKKYVVGNEKYKLGWHVKFSLEDGTTFDKTILDPNDVSEFYDYLEIYLYDSAHPEIGVWYSHLEQIEEDTIITSMKLTSGEKFNMINSPIEVKVFAYENIEEINDILLSENKVSTCLVYND